MEVQGLITPGGRRTTRAALAEIPVRLGQMHVTPMPFTPVNLNNVPNTLDQSPVMLPASYMSPAPSPDELVIQQRGRRKMPVTWSPDNDCRMRLPFQSSIHTPPKNLPPAFSPNKTLISLRSTPRKRLLMSDLDKTALTPEKIDFSDISTPQKLKVQSPNKASPSVKRLRIDKKTEAEFTGPLDVALKGLSNEQLVTLLGNLVQKHPELDLEIRREMPLPDLKPLEEKLSYLKRNIFKSLPTSRLTSKTDSPAFSRASTHILAFKKGVVEQGRSLVEAHQWSSVLEYSLLAWRYVRGTPLWDNHPHNAARRQCFKALSTYCTMALKKGNFNKALLTEIQDKLEEMIADSEDIQSCIKWVDGQLNSH